MNADAPMLGKHSPHRGRPRQISDAVAITAHVSRAQRDFLRQRAAEHRMTVSTLVRGLLRIYTRPIS